MEVTQAVLSSAFEDEEFRTPAARTAGELGASARFAVPYLVKMLAKDGSFQAPEAARSLCRILTAADK
jgi:hypothetical protein